jgi:phage terminase large subunit GpA-like protein
MNLPTPTAEEIYAASAAAGARPDPLLKISQWADRYRTLSQRASAEPGPWRTDRTPYLREIMDCLSPASPIERTVFMKGAQIGGTEAGNNWIGYVIHQAPGPMMAVQPTVEMAKRNSKQRLDPLIEESEALRALVSDPRSRDSGNTILAKEFPGGVLVMTGANSAVGLRSMAARYLFLDEVDGYPGDVEGEGDPVNLATARTRTFARRKIFMCSTPKITGSSRIEAAFEESDQRFYWVPCPVCREFQTLKFPELRWPKGQPEKAVYICEHCGQEIHNHQKQSMLARASGGQARRAMGRQPDSTCRACTRQWDGSPGQTPPSSSCRRRRIPPCFRYSSTRFWARLGRCRAKRRSGSGCTIAGRITGSA